MNMLAAVFEWLLAASLRASVLTMVVLALQLLLLRRRAGARVLYALWLPVLAVLTTPVRPESRWSIEGAFVREAARTPQIALADAQPLGLPVAAMAPAMVAAPHGASFDWRAARLHAWAGGSALLVAFGGVSLLQTLRRFRRDRQPVGDDLAGTVAGLAREIGLRCTPEVWLASAISSPAVTGLLRPVLLLPAQFSQHFTAGEARLILQHELMHLKRRDLPLNALMCLLIALHWFNPLLWLAFLKARADREAACDAQVLERAPPQRRIEYGHALIKAQSAFSPLRLSVGFVGLFQRGAILRSRIHAIASNPQTHPAMKLLATLSVFIMTFLGITRATTSTGENIIIEAKLIEITSEPNQPDDVEKVVAGLLDGLEVRREDGKPLFAVLGDSQYQVAMRRLSQRKRVDLMAAPRLVTPAGQKASIKVGREMTFPPEKKIPNLELGFTLDVMPERAANGLLDITVDSRLLEFEGLQRSASGIERPVLNERKAHDRVSMKPGETALIDLGSKIDTQRVEEEGADGKVIAAKTNRFTRRAIAFVTARTAEPARAKVAAAGFTTGKAVFRKGDDIRITQVQRGQGFLTVTADYELASAESASIALYVTSLTSSAAVKTDATQTKVVAKGKGTVVLHHPDLRDGLPHLSFYDLKSRKAFGCIYFGTKEEAEASRKLDLSYMTANEGEPSSSSTTRRDGAQQAITKLRAAPSQQYDFSKARLDDVLRYLATEAGLSFFSLPEDHPANDKVITFSIRASPFEVLETICRAYGLMLLPDGGIWYIRPADDRELIGKSYPQPATKSVGTEAILEDLQRIVGKGKEPEPTKPDGGFTPKVVFKASENAFYVVGTRLEHEWVSGYLKALSRVK